MNFEGNIKVVSNHILPEALNGVDPSSVHASRPFDKQTDASWRLIAKKDNDLLVFKLVGSHGTSLEAKLERTIRLQGEHERVISVSNGLAFIEDTQTGQSRSIYVQERDSSAELAVQPADPANK